MANDNYIFALFPNSDYPLPDYYEVFYHCWHEESMDLLSSRAQSEIARILLDIDTYAVNRMLNKYEGAADLKYAIQNLSHQNIDMLYQWDLYPGRLQFISLLHLKEEGKEPSLMSSVPGLKWEECFASLLLGKSIFASYKENKLKEVDFSLTPHADFCYDLGEYMGMFALDCMEIDIFLAGLTKRQGKGWGLQMKTFHSERSRKANDEKYKEPRRIKGKCYDWYNINKDKHKSIREAALAYVANELNEDEKKHLGEDPVRVLADYLRWREKAK